MNKRGTRSPAQSGLKLGSSQVHPVRWTCSAKLLGRKAQFYLMAAIIIITIIFGVFVVSNYIKSKPKETAIYDLKKELNLETGKVIDFAIYNKNDTNQLIESWIDSYVQLAGSKAENWIFIYGNGENITILSFTNTTTGEIGIEISGGPKYPVESGGRDKTVIRQQGEYINIYFGNYTYNFYLDPGQNFMFLIERESGEETHIT